MQYNYSVVKYFYVCIYSSEIWSYIPDEEKENIGLTRDDDGEFW